jgi:hypothetical protein
MRLLPALLLAATLSAAPPPSGVSSTAPFSSQTNALGGHYGAAAMGRPLGGIGRPTAPRRHGTGTVAVYGSSWYVPNYVEPDSSGPVEAAPPLAPPPVIINQYFAAPPPPPPQEVQPAPEEPKYLLIAYKDHSVYPVLTYWVEDKTMHYVTTQNTHNQASLDLIDLDRTNTLNQGR